MAKNKKPTQCERILAYLNRFGSITQYEAFRDLGVMRLASRISELKDRGYFFKTDMEHVRNRFGEKVLVARYRLVMN